MPIRPISPAASSAFVTLRAPPAAGGEGVISVLALTARRRARPRRAVDLCLRSRARLARAAGLGGFRAAVTEACALAVRWRRRRRFRAPALRLECGSEESTLDPLSVHMPHDGAAE